MSRSINVENTSTQTRPIFITIPMLPKVWEYFQAAVTLIAAAHTSFLLVDWNNRSDSVWWWHVFLVSVYSFEAVILMTIIVFF
jgi:hypothetical protein